MKYLKLCIIFFCLFTLVPYESIRAEEKETYYTILLKENENLNEWIKNLDSNKVQVTYTIEEIGLLQIKSTKSNIQKISQSTLINTYNQSLQSIHKNLNSKTNIHLSDSTLWNMQWDMKRVTNDGESYKIFPGTKNVTVGIVDTGIDVTHPDLKNNIVSGSKNLVPIGGFRGNENYETGSLDQIYDLKGHGTLVAGQVAANGQVKGVAPGIGIKSYRVIGGMQSENIWAIKGIVEAAKDDVDVINISLGDYLVDGIIYSQNDRSINNLAEIEGYKRAIKFAKNKGSAVVASAGNDSLDVKNEQQMINFYKKLNGENGEYNYNAKILNVPAGLPDVVTVASVGPNDDFSVFSNYGEDFIDIAAPGGDIRLLQEYGESDWINSGMYQKESVLSTLPGGYYFTSGNSMAAPKVSGALALIIDQNKFKKQPVKAINFLYKYGVNQKNNNRNLYGNGILDVHRALTISNMNK
ncbi:S8 family peptidase [Bacillus mycoides]|uniref:S8 family peptidase n=1 Tax=Bacillus mycoides TaxID=1405 RepID=UPI0003E2003B|nr:S8 family serine peptidase [Bacillus mycoides]ETT84689.1 MutP [Bacillus mycoides FSL H7-687]